MKWSWTAQKSYDRILSVNDRIVSALRWLWNKCLWSFTFSLYFMCDQMFPICILYFQSAFNFPNLRFCYQSTFFCFQSQILQLAFGSLSRFINYFGTKSQIQISNSVLNAIFSLWVKSFQSSWNYWNGIAVTDTDVNSYAHLILWY